VTNAVKKQAEQSEFSSLWEEFAAANPALQWVQDVRKRGQETFEAMGLPTTRSERYKYTNIPAAEAGRVFPFARSALGMSGDTRFLTSMAEEMPDWVRTLAEATPPGEAQYKDMALWHAVNAFMRDGVFIDVPKNTVDAKPLEITITGSDGTSFVPRSFIRVQSGAEFTIVERHTGEGSYWNNRVTQIIVEKGARLRHYRMQDNSNMAIYTQNTHVTVDRDGSYEAFVLTMGSALSRNQIHVDLIGENAETRLGGVNLLNGTQHGDTTITIEHQAPNCRSNQTYKSIIADKAHGVFQGKVHVHQIAQKTDGYQLSNTLLISPTARMDTKPELEIYADDVKCSHGSTTGQMDTAPLFYLRTRGLSEAQAKMLLMQAFLGPALDEIRDDAAREDFIQKATDWLEQQTNG
jgi:Fe-S cluster assembly protein SufD